MQEKLDLPLWKDAFLVIWKVHCRASGVASQLSAMSGPRLLSGLIIVR